MSIDLQNIDFKSMTPEQLATLAQKIESARAEVDRAHREKTKRDVLELIRAAGYHSIDELFTPAASSSGRGRRSAIAPKFRNPANPSQTWAGRGKRPRWFSDALAAGASEDSLRV